MPIDSKDPATSHIGANDGDLEAGTKVGEYEIEKKIGEGGFGTVYRAVHPLIGKVAAVKVLSRMYSAQPEMVSRFVAEARAVNQIQNSHIIDIFAFGRLEDGRHYYVMEFLNGLPLEDYITKCGRLEPAEAVSILRSVAKALDAAHAKGIAHRDLKPDNVFLVDNDGEYSPKLLDFGIAKLLSDDNKSNHKTKTGAPIGTPYYMSPEQCRGVDVDHRTDIYAFGIMTYKMLTGRVPFEGDDYMSILLQQMGDEAKPPSSIVPRLSPAIDEAVAWMMKKTPSERPPNLVTAVRSLESAASDSGIIVPVPPPPTGVYAARTSPLVPQSTPGQISRMGSTTPSASDIGLEATMAPGAAGAAVTGLGATAAPIQTRADAEEAPVGPVTASDMQPAEESGKRKSPILLFAVAGAAALAVLAFLVLGGSGDKSEKTAATASASSANPPGTANKAGAAVVAPAEPKRQRRRLVTITIEGPPAGTEVYGPRGLAGVAPGKIQLRESDQPIMLTLKARDYVAQSAEVIPSEDRTLEIELVPMEDKSAAQTTEEPDVAKKATKTKRKTKRKTKTKDPDKKSDRDSIEDPF